MSTEREEFKHVLAAASTVPTQEARNRICEHICRGVWRSELSERYDKLAAGTPKPPGSALLMKGAGFDQIYGRCAARCTGQPQSHSSYRHISCADVFTPAAQHLMETPDEP